MISLRLSVPAVLVTAALAGWFTYFVTPPPQVEADRLLSPQSRQMLVPDTDTPTKFDQPLSAEEERGDSFRKAAEAILKQAPDAQASAVTNELPITGHIPLPTRRLIGKISPRPAGDAR
jgi:hypothetical protein